MASRGGRAWWTATTRADQLYEQFAGFFGLEDIRAADMAERPFAGDVVLGVERVDRAQVVKQADVVMLAAHAP